MDVELPVVPEVEVDVEAAVEWVPNVPWVAPADEEMGINAWPLLLPWLLPLDEEP